MKALMFALVAAIAITGVAEEVAGGKPTPEEAAQRQTKNREVVLRKTGGFVVRPGSGTGKILVLNEQKRVVNDDIKSPVEYLKRYVRVNMELRESKAFEGLPTADLVESEGGNFAIFVRDDPKLNTSLLVAPDDRWAIVNVAALSKDNTAIENLKKRVRKEISRAFAALCGGFNSQYKLTPVNHVASLKDLDTIDMDDVPADLMTRFTAYLEGYGVKQYERATYRKACQNGWAPQPVNKYQQAIWDEFHSLPTNPIKIEPEK